MERLTGLVLGRFEKAVHLREGDLLIRVFYPTMRPREDNQTPQNSPNIAIK